MYPPKEQAAKPGLLRRIFGGDALSTSASPELGRSWASMQRIMPNETTATNRVRPMNRLERFIQPGAEAMAWPWGSIAVSPELEGNKLDQVLAHELTHIGQKSKGILPYLKQQITSAGKEYLARPEEQEALAAENELYKKLPTRDINLDRPILRAKR